MTDKNLNLLSDEQLKNKLKTTKLVFNFFAGFLVIYFIIGIIAFIQTKHFNFSWVSIFCLLPIYISQKDTLKKIEHELAKRNS